MKVLKFTYNGITGKLGPGAADYEAEFLKWTDDPGIGVFSCSDGKERKIPTCAVVGFNDDDFPKQELSKEALRQRSVFGIILGEPCHS